MKAISLWQPWATLWILQIKKFETRSWPFPKWHTGPVAIHAAKKKINLASMGEFFTLAVFENLEWLGIQYDDLPYGALIGVCDKLNSKQITDKANEDINQFHELEAILGDWTPGRYFWVPEKMRQLPVTIPYKGHQGIFNIPDELIFEGVLTKPKIKQQQLFEKH